MSSRPAVEERAVRLEVNGRTVHSWTASPGQAEALGAGRLLAEGFIDGPADLLELRADERGPVTVIRARVEPSGAAAGERARRAAAELLPEARSPGVANAVQAGHESIATRAPLPPLEAFPVQFREMFAAAERYQDIGGLHSAALSDGERIVYLVEEIGRHNAVDKVIGLALLAGDDLSRLGLLISARVSGEMARKAVLARLAWVASRSVPTTLAVAVAASAGLPLVARAPGRNPYVFAP